MKARLCLLTWRIALLTLCCFSAATAAWAAPLAGPRRQDAADLTLSGMTDPAWATQVSAGAAHTCALTPTGGVKCWGNNASGQLGDSTTLTRGAPVAVVGLAEGIVMVSAGGGHTCALIASGGVKCWGHNRFGQLGDGTTILRLTPVDVHGLTSGVQAILASGFHTCALTASGSVQCWGYNGLGQLGDGTTDSRLTPVEVVGLPGVMRSVSGGNYHSCALSANKGVWCWGSNAGGELGDGTTTNRLTPVEVVLAPVFDCASVTEIPQDECAALVALFEDTTGVLWQDRSGWLQTSTPCSWYAGLFSSTGIVAVCSLL